VHPTKDTKHTHRGGRQHVIHRTKDK
jgi:hypothetical protein